MGLVFFLLGFAAGCATSLAVFWAQRGVRWVYREIVKWRRFKRLEHPTERIRESDIRRWIDESERKRDE